MNIAFPALFIFLLALPGIVLRYSYREWGWKIPVYRLPVGDEIAKSMFSAAILDAGWCLLADRLGYRVNYAEVLVLLTGGFGLSSAALAARLERITANPGAIILYFLSLYVASAILGWTGRLLVRGCGLDLRFRLLRFENFWHYALNAEIPLFAENRDEYGELLRCPGNQVKRQKILVIVSCVVTHGSRSFVYFGFPLDYHFDRQGNLEKLVLDSVSYEELWSPREIAAGKLRHPLDLTKARSANVRGAIESDIFVLNAADAHNIGIEYLFLSPQDEQQPAQSRNAPVPPLVA